MNDALSGQRIHAAFAAAVLSHRASRSLFARVMSIALVLAWAAATPSSAEEGKEVHGSGDAYAATGAALAWAILRGADEASTRVVLRIVGDPQIYAAVAIVARNPFSGQERVLQLPIATTASVDVRLPRAQFADFPRTELRFYAPGSTTAPGLVVYYLGVPDTTPEFIDAAKLESYLDERIARARGEGKTP